MEWASAFGDRRAVFLTLALNRSLGEAVARDLLRHPVISGISGRQAQTGWRSLPRPKRLPPRAVALALADIVRKPGSSASLVNLMTALRSELAVESAEAVAVDGEILFLIERWFTEQMDRTSAGYKRWTTALDSCARPTADDRVRH